MEAESRKLQEGKAVVDLEMQSTSTQKQPDLQSSVGMHELMGGGATSRSPDTVLRHRSRRCVGAQKPLYHHQTRPPQRKQRRSTQARAGALILPSSSWVGVSLSRVPSTPTVLQSPLRREAVGWLITRPTNSAQLCDGAHRTLTPCERKLVLSGPASRVSVSNCQPVLVGAKSAVIEVDVCSGT